MANIKIFGNILSYATPSASGDLVPKWYVDAMAENPGQTTMTIMTGTSIAPTQTGQVFYKEVTANTSFTLNASGLSATNNEVCEFYLVINSSGKSVTFPSGWVWSGGSAPTIADGTSIIHVFTINAKTTWRAELLGAFPAIANSIIFTIQVPANTNIDLAHGEPFESPITATWGDGVTSEVTTGDLEHTYATAGTYQVKLKSSNGKMPVLYFSVNSDYIRSVDYVDVEWYGSALSGTNLIYVGEMFDQCEHLTTVPATLFARNSNIGDFGNCFRNCSGLESIPDGLFGNNTSARDFYRCFDGCSSLEAIPDGLFSGFSSVTTFERCFNGCTSLRSIPADTFEDCSAVTSFAGCFRFCSSITAIPSGLFADCQNVTSFTQCFENSGITTIPSGLFTANRSVTSFNSCFDTCHSLVTVPTNLFDNLTGKASFTACFSGCSSLAPSASPPYVPQVWEKDSATTSSACFSDTPASVRQYVPSGWGGNIPLYNYYTTYSKGDWVYYSWGGNTSVYTYINDTPSSDHTPDVSTDYWVYGYIASASTTITLQKNKTTGITLYDFDYENSTYIVSDDNSPITWTVGSFNSTTTSGSKQTGSTNVFTMSSWSLSGGVLTITLGAMANQMGVSGLTSGTVLTFGGFIESEDSTYYYATSTTYSKN